MKDSLKKLLCMVLALSCVLCFAACNKSEDSEDGKGEGKAESKAQEVVENYMDAMVELDFDKASKYLDDDSKFDEDNIPDEVKILTDEDLFKETYLADNPGDEMYIDDIVACWNKLTDKVYDSMDYEIEDIEEDDGDYIVSVKLTAPADGDFYDVFMSKVNDAVSEVNSSGAAANLTTVEEAVALIISEIDSLIDSTELETEEETNEFVVVEKDDEWVIDTEKSDIN